MKKILVWLLIGVLVLGLLGCGAQTAAPETTAAPAETELPAETEPAVPETAAEPAEQKPLYLKVGSITFSVVGESEDIYLGLTPRDQVIWESEDPDIVSVENGVLTANGVGTTTIRAVCGDLQAECTAGCLAQTREKLESMDPEILCKPKRTMPEVDLESPCTFYDHAALVGDSISYMLVQNESKGNYLGDLLFLTRGGTSMMGFAMRSKNISYQGVTMNLEEAIALSKVERMYILIGSNDLACDPNREAFFDNWDLMLSRIREKSPDVEIVMISNIPQHPAKDGKELARVDRYNGYVEEYNLKMQQYCKDNHCMYLDLCSYIQDHMGRMPTEYNLDGYHMNGAGYMTWIQVMRYYAQFELDGGSIA